MKLSNGRRTRAKLRYARIAALILLLVRAQAIRLVLSSSNECMITGSEHNELLFLKDDTSFENLAYEYENGSER